MITNSKYWILKQFGGGLTPDERAEVDEYESAQNAITPAMMAYMKKLSESEEHHEIIISYEELKKEFFSRFKQFTGNKFIHNEDTEQNIKTLLYYFTKDEKFNECEVHNESGLKKGLLVIGGYGNGKTESFRILENILKGISGYSFRAFNSNEIVEMYERCDKPEDKAAFWMKVNSGVKLFDDITTEREASNYGKANIIKDIIERRYDRKNVTYMSCNFPEGSESVEDTLDMIGERYGGRVYDRLFEMFNIIQWKGKSFRK